MSAADQLGNKIHGIFNQAFRAVGATFNPTQGERLRAVCNDLAKVFLRLIITSLNQLQDNVEAEFKDHDARINMAIEENIELKKKLAKTLDLVLELALKIPDPQAPETPGINE